MLGDMETPFEQMLCKIAETLAFSHSNMPPEKYQHVFLGNSLAYCDVLEKMCGADLVDADYYDYDEIRVNIHHAAGSIKFVYVMVLDEEMLQWSIGEVRWEV